MNKLNNKSKIKVMKRKMKINKIIKEQFKQPTLIFNINNKTNQINIKTNNKKSKINNKFCRKLNSNNRFNNNNNNY